MEPVKVNTHMKNISTNVDVTKINELFADSRIFQADFLSLALETREQPLFMTLVARHAN